MQISRVQADLPSRSWNIFVDMFVNFVAPHAPGPHVVVQWSSVFRFVQHVPTLWYRWIMRSPTGTKSASLFGNRVRDTFEPQLHKMRERKPTHQVVQSRRSTPCGRKVPMALGEPSAGFLESLSQELWVFVLLLVHHFCHVKKPFSVPIFRHTYLPICENMWKYVKICENMWKYVKICENMWKQNSQLSHWGLLPMPASPSSSMSSRLAVERQTWCPSFVHEVFLHVICGRCVFMLNRFTNQRW